MLRSHANKAYLNLRERERLLNISLITRKNDQSFLVGVFLHGIKLFGIKQFN